MNRELEAIFNALEAARENPRDSRLMDFYESMLDDVQVRVPSADRAQVRQMIWNLYLDWRKTKSPSTLPPKA